MAGNQSARRDAHAFDIEDWMAQRRADVQRLLQGAEATGSKVWAQSTRTGQNLSAPNPQDLKALGARASDGAAQALAGAAARQVGSAAGVVRAGIHDAEGAGDSMILAGRILDPLDQVWHTPDQKPLQPMAKMANDIVDYGVNAAVHPNSVVRDVGNQLQKWNAELNPYATPQAPTLAGELDRNFQIGMNQGELGAEAAALAFGSGALKVLPRLAPISEAAEKARFLKQGFSPEQAERLARPYDGMGQHLVPRRFEMPESYAGVPMPDSLVGWKPPPQLSDSMFNVLKPSNISQGRFYELHHKVDPYFYGAPIKRGSRGWSGRALGLEDKRYGLLGQLWHGSPAPLNVASGVLGGVALANHEANEGDDF